MPLERRRSSMEPPHRTHSVEPSRDERTKALLARELREQTRQARRREESARGEGGSTPKDNSSRASGGSVPASPAVRLAPVGPSSVLRELAESGRIKPVDGGRANGDAEPGDSPGVAHGDEGGAAAERAHGSRQLSAAVSAVAAKAGVGSGEDEWNENDLASFETGGGTFFSGGISGISGGFEAAATADDTEQREVEGSPWRDRDYGDRSPTGAGSELSRLMQYAQAPQAKARRARPNRPAAGWAWRRIGGGAGGGR